MQAGPKSTDPESVGAGPNCRNPYALIILARILPTTESMRPETANGRRAAVAVRLIEDPGRFAGKRFDLGNVTDATWSAAQKGGWSDAQLTDAFAYFGGDGIHRILSQLCANGRGCLARDPGKCSHFLGKTKRKIKI
jgi:hypothetical protein